MSTPAEQEAAARQRIITHMNNDHRDSVRRYVEYFAGTSSFTARSALLTDVSNNDLAISCGRATHRIPFDPPLKSLREVRERVVQMDKDALEGLGRHPITVNRYVWQNAASWALMTLTTVTVIAFSRSANFKPGSILYDTILVNFPNFTDFCLLVKPILIPFMAVIHGMEAIIMIRKCERHSVVPGSGVWWGWVASAFAEGFTSFKRMNTLIKAKEKERDSKRH